MRVPGGRRFAAGALAGVVAVFGVLALRVHEGDDPALANVKASTSSDATSSSATTVDPYATSSSDNTNNSSGDTTDNSGNANDGSSSSSSSVSPTPGASTSAS
jgi:hypothetical protein